MKTSTWIIVAGLAVAAASYTTLQIGEASRYEDHRAQATAKAVLCGRYCNPTVAYRFEDGSLEDRSYSLAGYEAIAVGEWYLVPRERPRTIPLGAYAAGLMLGLLTTLWALVARGASAMCGDPW